MKTYIVFDLEWNQSPNGKQDSIEEFPFEIIEIGAVKLNEKFEITDQFHRLIRPQVYQQMHYMISEVTHMDMQELREQGTYFPEAADEFIAWCGEGAEFCTWGSMDLTELQRNLAYYGMGNPFPKPLFYYDVQKIYGLFCKDGEKPSLDAAVEELELLEDRPFHRALDDAWYTGKVLSYMAKEPGAEEILPFYSIDYYRLPSDRKEEIRVTFPGYFKYVSRIFESREEAMKDRGVTEMKCYKCGRTLRKKMRWFTANQKIYLALAVCPEHGFLRGKIRMKKVDDTRVFVVKTLKITDEGGAADLTKRREEMRKKRLARNKAKKLRQREEGKASGLPRKKKRR